MSQPDTRDLIAVPARPEGDLSSELATLTRCVKAVLSRALQGDGVMDDLALRAIREASRLLDQSLRLADRIRDIEAGRTFDRLERQRQTVEAALKKHPAALRAVRRALAGQGTAQ